MTGEILAEVARLADVVVVEIERVRNAAESAEDLQAAQQIRLEDVLRTLDLVDVRPVRRELAELLIDRRRQLIGRVTGRAVATIWNTDDNDNDCCAAETSCAICLS